MVYIDTHAHMDKCRECKNIKHKNELNNTTQQYTYKYPSLQGQLKGWMWMGS